MNRYGAKISAGRNLYFDTETTKKLIADYLIDQD